MTRAILAATIVAGLPLAGCEGPGGQVTVLSGSTPGRIDLCLGAGRRARKRPSTRGQRHHPRAHQDRGRHKLGAQGLQPGRSRGGGAVGLLSCRPADKTDYSATSMGGRGALAHGVRG